MVKSVRLVLISLGGLILSASFGWALEDHVVSATSNLEDVLFNLKQSVDRLSVNNDRWMARDNSIRQQIAQLQGQLGDLENQGNLLEKQVSQLQSSNPRRAQQMKKLEEENTSLDIHLNKANVDIKLVQHALDLSFKQEQQLLMNLKGLAVAMPKTVKPLPLPVQQGSPNEKEKLKLMKMIYESQKRQELLHGAILDFQKNASLLPAAAALAHQKVLKEQIKMLEEELAGYHADAPVTVKNQWDTAQLGQLELELKALEKNYGQLKDLMAQMGKRFKNQGITASQQLEGQKIQNKMDDLSRQGITLRIELDELRSQMVDLDKRKSRLEEMIKHLF